MIVLWTFEGCEASQPVRERLSDLAVDYIIVNAPREHPEKDKVMHKLFGSGKTPAICNTRTGSLHQGPEDCLHYVNEIYG